MIYNTSGPLNPKIHKHIILERKELNKSLILIKESDNYVAVSGPRQFGKTTLLYQIQDDLPANKFGVVYIDLENAGDYKKNKFYNVISRTIMNSSLGLPENIKTTYPLDKVIDQDKFVEFLIFISEHTPKFQKLIFLIDEIGGVPQEIAWKSFLPSLRWIFNAGRGNGKEGRLCSRLRFVFAGSTDLLHYVGHNSPINNVCERVEIKEFDNEQVFRLTRKLEILGENQQKEIANSIYEWAGGHPYLTQKILSVVEGNIAAFSNGKSIKSLNELVESNIMSGQDKNVSHMVRMLESKPEYMTILYPVYKGVNKKDVKYKEELITTGLLRIDDETHFLKPRNKIYFHLINSLLDVNAVKLKSDSRIQSKLLLAVINIISSPKYIGEVVLETFGRSNPAISTKIFWGYAIIITLLLLVLGFIDANTVSKIFITFWRFFFPVK